jgi:hypothetical protein
LGFFTPADSAPRSRTDFQTGETTQLDFGPVPRFVTNFGSNWRRTTLKRISLALIVVSLISAGGTGKVFAQSPNPGARPIPAVASLVPNSAFFAGIGGSFNSINFSNQNIFAQGVSNIYLNGTQVAFGAAGGPTDPTLATRSGLSPTVQGGYFQHFAASDWLWGAKFTYSYLGASSTDQNVIVPQVGSFTSATPDTFTGNVVVRSYQVAVNHQMTFIPFIGRSFERSLVYFGVGPSLTQTRSRLNGVIGFAAINGQHLNITGAPSDFSSVQWLWGGAATIGATYFLDRNWFVDMNYTYGMTENRTTAFSGPFASATDGYTDTGILSGNYSGRIITQSVALSINRAF